MVKKVFAHLVFSYEMIFYILKQNPVLFFS